jgi:hypothetical protein
MMIKAELIEKLKAIITPYVQDEVAFKNLTEDTDFIKDLKSQGVPVIFSTQFSRCYFRYRRRVRYPFRQSGYGANAYCKICDGHCNCKVKWLK